MNRAAHAVPPDRFGIIIGAMKSGTTSLHSYLATHPQVAASDPKEPNFFSDEEIDPDDLGPYYRFWDWQPGIHRIALEASVNYTKMPAKPNCAERIARCKGLDVRFVYIMRNPLERLTSHVFHGVHQGWTPPLEEGVSEHAIHCSRYATQLEPYVSLFGRERVHLMVLEEFRRTPQAHLRRLCEFFEIDPDFEFRDVGVSHNKASEHFVEHPLWSRLREIGPLRRLASAIPSSLRESLRRSTGPTLDVRRDLTPSERDSVVRELTPDLRRLRDRFGIDASSTWGIDLD